MLRIIFIAVIIALLLLPDSHARAAPQPQQSGSLRIGIETVVAQPGETVEVAITAAGIPSPGLSVFNLLISFDAAVVEVASVRSGGSPWGSPIVSLNNSGGSVRVANVYSQGVMGNSTLAVLVLRVAPTATGVSALRLESASAVSVNASVLQAGVQHGAVRVSGAAMPTPIGPPPLFPTQTPPPTTAPTQAPTPTMVPTPTPTEAPTPTLAPTPTPTVVPVAPVSSPTPTPLAPTASPTVPPPAPGPVEGVSSAKFSWEVTLSVQVSQEDAARLDSLLRAAGTNGRTSSGVLSPQAENGVIVYEVPVAGMRRNASLRGSFDSALGALSLRTTNGAGLATVTLSPGAEVTGNARLVPGNGVLRVELREPRLRVSSSVLITDGLEGVHPQARQIAAALDAELTGLPERGVITLSFVEEEDSSFASPRGVSQVADQSGQSGQTEDLAFSVRMQTAGLGNLLGAGTVSLWTAQEWYGPRASSGKEMAIARVPGDNLAGRLEPAECASAEGMVRCTAQFNDGLDGTAAYALVAVPAQPSGSGVAVPPAQEGNALPGVLVVLIGVIVAVMLFAWIARLMTLARGHHG